MPLSGLSMAWPRLPTGLVRFTVLGGVGVDTELGVGAESVHLLPPGPDRAEGHRIAS